MIDTLRSIRSRPRRLIDARAGLRPASAAPPADSAGLSAAGRAAGGAEIVTRFDRLELKFQMKREQARELAPVLLERLFPDPYGDDAGLYEVLTVYYDSPFYDVYLDRARGITPRHKLRLRVYAFGTAGQAVFVEIKTNLGQRIVKRRVQLPLEAALRVCHGEASAAQLSELDQSVVHDVHLMVHRRRLEPMALIRYSRRALFGMNHDAGLRVTFDTEVAYRLEHPEDLADRRMDGAAIDPAAAQLEVKADDTVPFWTTCAVADSGAGMRSFSKYCEALEKGGRIRPDGEAPAFPVVA